MNVRCDAEPTHNAPESSVTIAEVCVIAPVRTLLTYRVPHGVDYPLMGCRVVVPLGSRRVGGVVIVSRASVSTHDFGSIKTIVEVLDREPTFEADLLSLLSWAADYYCVPLGELLRAALPSFLSVKDRRRVCLSSLGEEVLAAHDAILTRMDHSATEDQIALLRHLNEHREGQTRAALQKQGILRTTLAHAISKAWVHYEETTSTPTSMKTDLLIDLVAQPDPSSMAALERTPKQKALWQHLQTTHQRIQGPFLLQQLDDLDDRRALRSHLKRLEAKQLIRTETVQVIRDPFGSELPTEDMRHPLTSEQTTAVTTLSEAASSGEFRGFVLHGVTGSGKTEVYLRVIEHVLALGCSALVLVPEIALTPQLARRFRARFSNDVAVLHSGLTDGQRHDQWQLIRRGRVRIVVGARSAIFAPMARLGMIVVDEEHDHSFKQEDGVRYNARDLALVRAKRSKAIAVLGSATPSLESYHGVTQQRLSLIEMPYRATPKPLPEVRVVDLRVYRPDTQTMLSAPLAEALTECLVRREQAILFLNRRGFSTFVLCKACGEALNCSACSVSLTYHRSREQVLCHYCGFSMKLPSRCPRCAHAELSLLGYGTERIEEGLSARFPEARIARLDRDTATTKGLKQILHDMHERTIDILLGTQMVTKGHDFPHVTLVGVLCADLSLHFPDFRAGERTYQLLAQVAGRAGRGERAGNVIIQTYLEHHPSIQCARDHDYRAFFSTESKQRADLGYPPFGYLAAIHLDGLDARHVQDVAMKIVEKVRHLGIPRDVELLGPAAAPIQRLKNKVRWMIFIKSRAGRQPLRWLVNQLLHEAEPLRRGKVRITVDIDPYSVM